MKSRFFFHRATLLVMGSVLLAGCITTSFRPYSRRMHPSPASDSLLSDPGTTLITSEHIERTLAAGLGKYEILKLHYENAHHAGFFFLSGVLYCKRVSFPLLLMSRRDTVSIVKIVRNSGDDDIAVYYHSISSGGTPEPLDGIFILTSNGRFSEPAAPDADPWPNRVSYVIPHDFAAQLKQADEIGISFYDPDDNGNVVWLDRGQREVLKDFLDYTDNLTYAALARAD
jgi:hypothetical protein